MMNVESMPSRVPGTKLDVGCFATIEEARAWLTRPSTPTPVSIEAKSFDQDEPLSTSASGNVHLDEPWLSIRWDGTHRCDYAEFKALPTARTFEMEPATSSTRSGRDTPPRLSAAAWRSAGK